MDAALQPISKAASPDTPRTNCPGESQIFQALAQRIPLACNNDVPPTGHTSRLSLSVTNGRWTGATTCPLLSS